MNEWTNRRDEVEQGARYMSNVRTVVDYLMYYWEGCEYPAEIMEALCELCWPERRFHCPEVQSIESESGWPGLVMFEHICDVKTKETAQALLDAEFVAVK